MPNRIVIDVDRDEWTGKLQLSINQLNETGVGHGYRLAGPKFNGSGKNLLTRELDERDVSEIRGYLDAVFPLPPAPVWNFTDGEDWRPDGDPFATRVLAQLAAEIDYTNRTGETGTFTWADSTEEQGAVDMYLDGIPTEWRVWRIKVTTEVDVPMEDLTDAQRALLAAASTGGE
jgi:hypothetical protein